MWRGPASFFPVDQLPSGVPDDKLWFLGSHLCPCGAPGTVLSEMQKPQVPAPPPPRQYIWEVSVDNGEITPVKGSDPRTGVDPAGPVWGLRPWGAGTRVCSLLLLLHGLGWDRGAGSHLDRVMCRGRGASGCGRDTWL